MLASITLERSRMSTGSPVTVRSKKIKAFLAGGLVLGVGATVTLAAWSDQAFVQGIFETSSFNVAVSTDGTNWEEAETQDEAATLAFELPLTENLQPGTTVYAPLTIGTTEGSVAGTAALETASLLTGEQALFDALTYTVAETATCAAEGLAAAANDLVPAGSALDAAPAGEVLTLGADSDDPANLCFAVTLPETADDPALQGLGLTVVWRLAAESVSD